MVASKKAKGRRHERMENMEAKNLPNGRTLTTTTSIKIKLQSPKATPKP